MKNYSQFIKEEISIKGNKGVPEEKLREIERKGAAKVAGQQPHQIGGRLMELLRKSDGYIRGNQEALQKLAKKAVKNYFGAVLHNVDLEVDLTQSGNEIGDFLKNQDKKNKEKFEQNKKTLLDKLKNLKDKLKGDDLSEKEKKDCQGQCSRIENYLGMSGQNPSLNPEEVRLAVDKRKLINNFIQGEAKNVKAILHLDEVKNGLKEIYGEQKGTEAFNTWDEMTKLADKLDWLIDPHLRGAQMERNPSGFAGGVSTEKPLPKFDSPEEAEENEKAKKDIIEKMEKGEVPKDSEEVRKALNKSVIRVKAIDFPMLIHELVKGVYELISNIALPAKEDLAKEVHKQTGSFADEAEDWRYGPYLAEDLNNFIMKNPKVQKYPNVKEYVFAKLIDRNRWTDEQCLLNLKNIFLESPDGRKIVDMLVDEVVDAFDDYQKKLDDWKKRKEEHEQRKKEEEEAKKWAKETSKEEESEIDKLVRQSAERETSTDYSQMSQREISELIDDALDRGDYEQVELLSKYLKEGKEIYLRELQRINEMKRFSRK